MSHPTLEQFLSEHQVPRDLVDFTGAFPPKRFDGLGTDTRWVWSAEKKLKSGRLVQIVKVGDWKDSDLDARWISESGLAGEERSELDRRIEEERVRMNAERAQAAENAASFAETKFSQAKSDGHSPYFARKGLGPGLYGCRLDGDGETALTLVPARNIEGKLVGIQTILAKAPNDSPDKLFTRGMATKGAFHVVGSLDESGTAWFCEGIATAISFHDATAFTVVSCFNAGNLRPVAESFRKKYPKLKMKIFADNDQWKDTGNTGVKAAIDAARVVNAEISAPLFSDADSGKKPTDANDLHVLRGKEAVLAAVRKTYPAPPARKGGKPEDAAATALLALLDWENNFEKIKEDIGLLFHPTTLLGLTAIREFYPAEFARVKLALKGLKNFSGRDFDRAMKSAEPAPEDAPRPNEIYFVAKNRTFMNVRTSRGEFVQELCGFAANIEEECIYDDGVERTRHFLIAGILGNGKKMSPIDVPSREFPAMNWWMDGWGARAIINAGSTSKDHLRAAIQILSGDIPTREVFTHTGWRKTPAGDPVYLHSGGGLTKDGLSKEFQVKLSGNRMSLFTLPEPSDTETTKRMVRTALDFLSIAPLKISLPLFAAIFRAPLGAFLPNDFALFVVGKTGVFKSAVTGVVQSFYGSGFDERNLPGNWSSTDNALERLAFLTKDAILVIDDFAPRGSQNDVAQMNKKADRFFRNIGNQTGRGRMRADQSLRPENPPRALVIASGEEVPTGQSLRARTLIVEIPPGAVNLEALTRFQAAGRSGELVSAMSAFLIWMASKNSEHQTTIRKRRDELRTTMLGNGTHRRTPDLLANLAVAVELFSEFATDIGVMTAEEKSAFLTSSTEALTEIGLEQARYIAEEDPTGQFMNLLQAAILSGQAHVADAKGNLSGPPDAEFWGYSGTSPRGLTVGWISGDELLIDPAVALQVTGRMTQGQALGMAISQQTLGKRLVERGLILSEEGKNSVKREITDGEIQKRKRCWVFPDKSKFQADLKSEFQAQRAEVGSGHF